MKRLGRKSLLAFAALGLIAPAGAGATVVTIGSPLTASFAPVGSGSSATFVETQTPELGANLTSPVTGVIVRWRLLQFTGGPFKLRVLTHVAGDTYTATGSSAPQTPSSTALQTYSTNLPIKAGQTIGIDVANVSDQLGLAFVTGATYGYFAPPIADGSTLPFSSTLTGREIGLNADIATVPPNAYSFDGVALNKKTGTATLAVVVPGPGTLSLTGKGVKAQRSAREATASKAVSTAGLVNLLIKPKGKAKKKLKKTGRAKVKVKVTYTPTGGTAASQSKKIKLIKKH